MHFLPQTLAIFNNITPGSLLVLALLGLLLFGKELPTMARNAARQYYRYKRMITEATSDIRREMDNAADQIEEEKRKLEREVHKEMDSAKSSIESGVSSDEYASSDAYLNGSSGSGDSASPYSSPTVTPEPPPKPKADPLSLDVASPGTISHKATDAVQSPAAQIAKLDTIQKNVPPPKKIPPPL